MPAGSEPWQAWMRLPGDRRHRARLRPRSVRRRALPRRPRGRRGAQGPMPAAATPTSSRRASPPTARTPDAQGRRARGRVRDGRVLLVRERSDGGWTLPGGWADIGEPPAAAALREAREVQLGGPRPPSCSPSTIATGTTSPAPAAHLQAVLPLRADRRRRLDAPTTRWTTSSSSRATRSRAALDRVGRPSRSSRPPSPTTTTGRCRPSSTNRSGGPSSARSRGIVGRPNAISTARWTRSAAPSQPKTASRTGSTQWYSRFSCARVRAHSGGWSIGKNVPATRNSGVSAALITSLKFSIDFIAAAIVVPKPAQPDHGDEADQRHGQHAPARVEPEHHRHEHRRAARRAGPDGDPQHLGRDEAPRCPPARRGWRRRCWNSALT